MEVFTSSEILSSIGATRLRELASLIESNTSDEPLLTGEAHMLSVQIGSRRQLVLHTQQHLRSVQSFVKVLGLTPTDLRIVTVCGLHQRTHDWITEAKLSEFVVPAEEAGKDFRVDTAEQGDPPEPVTNRAVLVPSTNAGRRIRTTQELLIVWAAMHAAPPVNLLGGNDHVATVSSVSSASPKSGN